MGSTWVPLLKHPVWFVPLALIFLPLFSPLNASLQSYVINDAPVQIIKPSKDHKMLIIDKENMKAISKITGPVATIGVVGKFHSGKSFLMNQLMGKTKGFGIGPSVRPETMGIWMWGEVQFLSLLLFGRFFSLFASLLLRYPSFIQEYSMHFFCKVILCHH
nr:guanylate-binding protein 4-like [Rhipicephalus microplus]